MNLEITEHEQQILVNLLDSHRRDLHPTIRRSRVSTVTEELKHDLEDVERLLERVRSAGGAPAESPDQPAP
jgi:hypothetical protein